MVRLAVEKAQKLIQKIKFRIKLKEMDDWWYYTGGNCFGLFPPSFYYTHTQKEIEKITTEEKRKLRALIEQLNEYELPKQLPE